MAYVQNARRPVLQIQEKWLSIIHNFLLQDSFVEQYNKIIDFKNT